MEHHAQLTTLKEKLVQARDFMPVMDYFMTHFGENPQFMTLGERAHHPVIEAAIIQTIQQLFGASISPHQLLLTRLPEERFIHGGGMFASQVLTVLYFEDLQMGLLAVTAPFGSDEIKLARFTGTILSNN